MLFQLDVEYDGIDKLIQYALDYFNSPEVIKKQKPHINMEDIDPFFLDLIKQHNLGTKITGVAIHGMRKGSNFAAGHLHAKDRGVFYLQVPEGVGSLSFPNLDITIKPHRGLFVVVPAEENHAMSENKSDEIRLALACLCVVFVSLLLLVS